jgi:hypothetical protein
LHSQSISQADVQDYEMNIDVFLGMFTDIYPDRLIDDLSFFLPDDVIIINYGIGDFSGDDYLDVAMSYKDSTCSGNSYKVAFFVNNTNYFFDKVYEFTAEWKETPFDIGFSINNNILNVTQRRNKNWIFSSYTYSDNKLILIREEIY